MKFAYLIMAHDNQQQLLNLLRLLDQAENDIYLHIDKKGTTFDFEVINHCIKKADFHVYNKYDIQWAGISQTECQVFLLSEAVKTYHDYYHLISGHDLPIKRHTEIVDFFEKNKGKEFVHFESDDFCTKEACKYYHFGQNYGRGVSVGRYQQLLEKISIRLQKALGINRKFYCGANWYSITHCLASDFCHYKDKMLKMVRWTRSSDEYILQTFIRMVSKNEYEFYRKTERPEDYRGTARLIDWYRGQPYVWRKEDLDELMNSDRMFARKFDENIDPEIIKEVTDLCMSR